MLKGVPSPICWIHEWRGRPGCRRQPGPKRWPVLAAATCDNARWAGVWSSSLTTWPNSEFRLLAMTSRTEGRLVRSTTSVFLTKSCQRIPRIIRWQRMWKASSFRRSSCRSVHVSEPYNKMDNIQVWYRQSFVCSWSLSPDYAESDLMHGLRCYVCWPMWSVKSCIINLYTYIGCIHAT